jgi:hypothetical protein
LSKYTYELNGKNGQDFIMFAMSYFEDYGWLNKERLPKLFSLSELARSINLQIRQEFMALFKLLKASEGHRKQNPSARYYDWGTAIGPCFPHPTVEISCCLTGANAAQLVKAYLMDVRQAP